MFKELGKLWKDTTQNPVTGAYSQKRVSTVIMFMVGILFCFTRVISLHIWPDPSFSLIPADLELIALLFSGGSITAWLTLKGHMNSRKTQDENGAPLAPPYVEPINPEEENGQNIPR